MHMKKSIPDTLVIITRVELHKFYLQYKNCVPSQVPRNCIITCIYLSVSVSYFNF